jgi:hypothetical protein
VWNKVIIIKASRGLTSRQENNTRNLQKHEYNLEILLQCSQIVDIALNCG